ncbi:hypothetical protein HQ520_14630 [bacterium]|nr:hypothetical protein [bacterium]
MMRRHPHALIRLLPKALLLLCLLGQIGCAGLKVTPLPSPHIVALDTDDTVRILRRGGFSDKEILELGADLRDALAIQGAARICNGHITEAIFAVHDPFLHVSTRKRGTFIYNLEKRQFR